MDLQAVQPAPGRSAYAAEGPHRCVGVGACAGVCECVCLGACVGVCECVCLGACVGACVEVSEWLGVLGCLSG